MKTNTLTIILISSLFCHLYTNDSLVTSSKYFELSVEAGVFSYTSIGYGWVNENRSEQSFNFRYGTDILHKSFSEIYSFGIFSRKSYPALSEKSLFYYDIGVDFTYFSNWSNWFSGSEEGSKRLVTPNFAIGYGYIFKLDNGNVIMLTSDIGLKLLIFNIGLSYKF
ncbi:MAG: hypothetical protein RBS89_01285 [Candidatus Delongbacteria bacterium]|nr:hypothetical protein [Candidatus Delongbacteria bacterium]